MCYTIPILTRNALQVVILLADAIGDLFNFDSRCISKTSTVCRNEPKSLPMKSSASHQGAILTHHAAVGVGPATITTVKGQAGTGILWISNTNGVRAYGAVPFSGKLPRITLPATPGVPKFTHPAFGNGRYYVGISGGTILAFGAPVALPLTCSSPLDFGSVGIGNSSTLVMNCTANIAITKIVGLSIASPLFQAQNSSLPTGSLKLEQIFHSRSLSI